MIFKSINPYNNQLIEEHSSHDDVAVQSILKNAQESFEIWRKTSISDRSGLMVNAGKVLLENKDEYAQMITAEMGKPIKEARAEIDKCVKVCNYYAEKAHEFLADEVVETEARKSYVKHEPIGCVLAIMPWNYPYWQVFRFAAPTLMAGNTGILKHAPNVLGCAKIIENVFIKAGFPKGVFQNLIIHHDKTEEVVGSDVIKAVTLTGSERAGAAVAEIAGRHIKKTLLELGGNNAFIVLEDADIDYSVSVAVNARMMNSGQSCIAAKRFILVDSIYDEFLEKFTNAIAKLKSGDPMDESTEIGVLARRDLADQLQAQVRETQAQGAALILGGEQNDCYHEPTILAGVKPGMVAFDDETFGPLAAICRAKDMDEAFTLANKSSYGLGVMVFTTNVEKAVEMSSRVDDGAYFINQLVHSDPRLPFGGEKKSGYGRELAKEGMMEFVNRKTIYIK